jgi:uroporphyrinogen decarboxylase
LPQYAKTKADVIGLDWRIGFADARGLLGNRPVQGNLDPAILMSDFKEIERQAKMILDQNAGRPGHIFNLGHGVFPGTPVENVLHLIEFVKEYSAKL